MKVFLKIMGMISRISGRAILKKRSSGRKQKDNDDDINKCWESSWDGQGQEVLLEMIIPEGVVERVTHSLGGKGHDGLE